MKINCIIIDDEPLAIKVIESYLKDFPEISIVKTFYNPLEALLTLEDYPIDVIFLDINMARMNGMDFLRNTKITPFVIITSAYKEYAIESYDLNVLDYLVKPIPFQRFLKAINKLTQQLSLRRNAQLEYQIQPSVFFKVDKKMVKVMEDDIYYIEGLKDYVKVFTSTTYHVVHKSLSTIMDDLPSSKFLRIHRSYIIALNKVESLEGNTVEVKSKKIPIGRVYTATVKQIILGQA